MQIIILCFTVAVIYLIVAKAYKMLTKASVQDKMEKIETTEELSNKVLDFNKRHKTYKKDKERLKKFNKQ